MRSMAPPGRLSSKTLFSKNKIGAPRILETGSEMLFPTFIKLPDTNPVRLSGRKQTALSELPTIIWPRSRPPVLYDANAGPNPGRASYEVAPRAYLKVPFAQRTMKARQERKMRRARHSRYPPLQFSRTAMHCQGPPQRRTLLPALILQLPLAVILHQHPPR